MRDVYSQKQVKIGPIDVRDGEKLYSESNVKDDVTFTIYNSTLQKINQVVTTKDGKLPELTLTEGFNYILWSWIIPDGIWQIGTIGSIMENFVT